MNDDEYDFDFTENSRLSALFGKDSETGNSSLTYKAPKQPGTVSSSTSKTFHKYIKLYENHSGKLYGKYIIAILALDSNISEMLIYQTKKFILIRQPVLGNAVYTYINDKIIILKTKEQQFRLEFENEMDHFDFSTEYVKNGGIIELFEAQNGIKKKLSEIEYPQESQGSFNQGVKSNTAKNEKNCVLTRFERMGLPQLLPNQIDQEDIKNYTSDDDTTKNKNESKGNGKFYVSEDTSPNISFTKNIHKKDNIPCPTLKNNVEETDLLISVLKDIQTKNTQWNEAICLLTSRLKELIPNEVYNSSMKVKKLESRIKSLELKSENLQNELKNVDKKNIENKEMHEISCQTDSSENIHGETIHLEPIVIQILDIFKSHSFSSDEISKLKNWVYNTGGDQGMLKLQPYFNAIEKKNISENNLMRNEFVGELKVTMNNLYQNICDLQTDDFNGLLVKEIKQASSDILNIFDNLSHKTSD